MRLLILLAACGLTGCQTVTVNGYEVTRRDQAAIAVGAVFVGAVIAAHADKDSPPEASNPGKVECAVDLETGNCR